MSTIGTAPAAELYGELDNHAPDLGKTGEICVAINHTFGSTYLFS